MTKRTTRKLAAPEIISALPKLSKRDLHLVIAAANAEERDRFEAACAAYPKYPHR